MTNSPFIAFVSDPHLSQDRPFFQLNWEILLDELSRRPPELVIVGGDITLDGASNAADLRFARQQLDRLPCPWLAVPGNHDVGDLATSAHVASRVSEERRNSYLDAIGKDFWSFDFANWRIIGLNSMIFASGLPSEAEQETFLEQAIASAGTRQVAVLSHIAVCDNALAEVDPTGWFMPEETRMMLGRYINSGKIQLFLSGDMHESRDRTIDGVRHIWASSTAFVTDMMEEWRPKFGGRKRVGWTELELGEEVSAQVHEPRRMVDFDLGNWVQDGATLYYEFARGSRFTGFGSAKDTAA
ncbi:metallophosphoesterase [Sinorhizobium meliloti]|uniref:metallophosphoesterase family protein n=1 Tax=Rhizobium meliloti TaxID=382 RepID=UPI000FE10235|nr:metallophosphoesterase [Sinorhizobium meliloti]RVK89404.1 metallophosphoesterase [Sinorhizobium meliloti]